MQQTKKWLQPRQVIVQTTKCNKNDFFVYRMVKIIDLFYCPFFIRFSPSHSRSAQAVEAQAMCPTLQA